MMSVPESIAWLEVSRDSSPTAQIYATTILGELERLSTALAACANELDTLERLRHEAVTAHRALESTFDALEERAKNAREQWDSQRTDLEARLTVARSDLEVAQNMLRDLHHALLNQPDMTREHLADVITSVVKPYPEGAKA